MTLERSRAAGRQLTSEFLHGSEFKRQVQYFEKQFRDLFAYVTRVVDVKSKEAKTILIQLKPLQSK